LKVKLEIGDRVLFRAQNGTPIKGVLTDIQYENNPFFKTLYIFNVNSVNGTFYDNDEWTIKESELEYLPTLFEPGTGKSVFKQLFCYDKESLRNHKIDQLIE
jgi:hypothetical protein